LAIEGLELVLDPKLSLDPIYELYRRDIFGASSHEEVALPDLI
jgi:hypothetical protein